MHRHICVICHDVLVYYPGCAALLLGEMIPVLEVNGGWRTACVIASHSHFEGPV